MDIKKTGGLPLPQSESPLSVSKSGAVPRQPITAPPPTQPFWQSGQVLQALVLKATPEQMLLNIQGIQASVARPPTLSLHPGDRLQLEVLKNTPPLQLKLIDVQAATTTLTSRALRTSLPQQQALPPLLANIEYLSRNPAAANQFDKAVRTAAQQFYYQLPTPESLRQPATLKQALELSGPFFESNLKGSQQTGGLNIQQDTRTNLLRLSTQLQYYIARETDPSRIARQAPLPTSSETTRLATEATPSTQRSIAPVISSTNPQAQPAIAASLAQNSPLRAAEQLLQQTEGVLARLHIHQLHQLKSEESFRPGWSMELPVRSEQGINLFDIRIQREPPFPTPWTDEDGLRRQTETGQRWSVRLAFDLEGLGPVQVVIALQQEQISVHFHAEEAPTNTLFNEYLATLGSRLRHAGLEVAGIDCRQGKPELAEETINAPLVDEQA